MNDNVTFYKDLDTVKSSILTTLNSFSQSKILQNYFYNKYESLIYANIIHHFFENLTKENLLEYKIHRGNIGKIRSENKQLLSDVRLALKLKKNRINSRTYQKFKTKLKTDFCELSRFLHIIEKQNNIKELKKYLYNARKEIYSAGKKNQNLNDFILTTVNEAFIKTKGSIPSEKDYKNLMKVFEKELLPSFSQRTRNSLDLKAKSMLKNQRSIQKNFEINLYKRWEKAIDLFEGLIRVSEETGEIQKNKLNKNINNTNKDKYSTIIKIHVRALQIAKEILILVKSGYADGANARWRSLHELAVIALFLFDNPNEMSQRYLDHIPVKNFKEAQSYNSYCKKLGYAPIRKNEFTKMKQDHDKMILKYGKDFDYSNGYEWIPKEGKRKVSLKYMEEKVKLDHLHPFYNMSCNSVHGGAKGFYRLGLIDSMQDQILLTGSSNYGFSDPIHNTVHSLVLISVCLLCLEPDFESLIYSQILNSYLKDIGPVAEDIQNQLEEEEQIINKSK